MKEIKVHAKLTEAGLKYFRHLKDKPAIMIFRKNDKLKMPQIVRIKVGKSKYSQTYHQSYWQPLCKCIEIIF